MDDHVNFTPPMADVAAQTEAGLWDGMDLSEFDAARAALIDRMAPADRMLVILAHEGLTPTAYRVGAVLAYHGWVSWPSLDTLAALLHLKKPHVSRAITNLERHGCIRRSKRFSGRGTVSTQYTFSGLSVVHVLDSEGSGQLSMRVRIPRGRDYQIGNGAAEGGTRDYQIGNGEAEGGTRDDQSGNGTAMRDDQIGNGEAGVGVHDDQIGNGAAGPEVRDDQIGNGEGQGGTRDYRIGNSPRLRDYQFGNQTGILTGREEEEDKSSSSGSFRFSTHDDSHAEAEIQAVLEEYRGYIGSWESEGAAIRYYAANPKRFEIDLADAQRRKTRDEEGPKSGTNYLAEYQRRNGHLPWEAL